MVGTAVVVEWPATIKAVMAKASTATIKMWRIPRLFISGALYCAAFGRTRARAKSPSPNLSPAYGGEGPERSEGEFYCAFHLYGCGSNFLYFDVPA